MQDTWDLAKTSQDLVKIVRDLAETFQDLAKILWDLAKTFQDLAKILWDLAKIVRDLAKTSTRCYDEDLTGSSQDGWNILLLDRI